MNIHWYPGHMTKAKRQIKEDMKLVDVVIEMLDARIPISSRNPDIDELSLNKKRIILLNKSDLCDNNDILKYIEYYKKQGIIALPVNSKKINKTEINKIILELMKEKIERDRKKGIKNRVIKTIILGIPNVGKSTFINSYSKKSIAKTGNKPGVTKSNQWIKLSKDVFLLDTPGILWPKFEDQEVAIKLALIGTIKSEILDSVNLTQKLIEYIKNIDSVSLENYFGENFELPIQYIEFFAKKRGFIEKEGKLNIEKASYTILNDYRENKITNKLLDVL